MLKIYLKVNVLGKWKLLIYLFHYFSCVMWIFVRNLFIVSFHILFWWTHVWFLIPKSLISHFLILWKSSIVCPTNYSIIQEKTRNFWTTPNSGIQSSSSKTFAMKLARQIIIHHFLHTKWTHSRTETLIFHSSKCWSQTELENLIN